MRIVIFCHSLLSDWNHGNAHFLRGVCTELIERGHDVISWEPRDAWSLTNLVAAHGSQPLADFRAAYPLLEPRQYDPATVDIEAAVDGADLVIVHEWNEPGLVARIGAVRACGAAFRLLFHDTHHRAATAPAEMERFDLSGYDGVLAFGSAIREIYLERCWTQRAWTWHEAADTRVFRPLRDRTQPARDGSFDGDVIWIGNWGDDERTAELREFFIDPVAELGASAVVHGVRYPGDVRQLLARNGIEYASWVPNFRVPQRFARFRATVHVPRGPYARMLPGIPTIRPFEALACGIPLVSAPWSDSEGLFRRDVDYLAAPDGTAMRRHLRDVLHDDALAASLSAHGVDTILQQHTCAHRAEQLLGIYAGIAPARHSAAADAGGITPAPAAS